MLPRVTLLPKGVFMASVTKKDIPQESAMMGDLWELIKKYYIPENTEEYWDSAYKAIYELHVKYPSELCRKLVLGFWGYLEEKDLAMRGVKPTAVTALEKSK